jgi:hypothetical protein
MLCVANQPGVWVLPQKHRHLLFAVANNKTKWDAILFTYRKKFLFRCPGSKVRQVQWARRSQRVEVVAASHSMALNIYAGITKHGVTKCHIVTVGNK